MSYAKKLAGTALEVASFLLPKNHPSLVLALSQVHLRPTRPSLDHLRYAMEWLKKAQDVTESGGVSHGYRSKVPVRRKGRTGWNTAYPETTGYIIETFLRNAQMTKDDDCLRRARRMADWELEIQRSDGGIQGGVIGAQIVQSCGFNTGQVIFGWLSAFEKFENPAYLGAATRAGEYLVSCLAEDGRFFAGHSAFCAPGPKAYETRTGWALAWAGRKTGREDFLRAARSVGMYALRCQQPNGWFSNNDLEHHDIPLTHTISYVLEGLLGMGRALDEPRFLEAVRLTLDQIAELVEPNGFLAGRWSSSWEPSSRWSCLTGSCQLASVFFRAHEERLGDERYLDAAKRLVQFVAATQRRGDSSSPIVGGIQGSYPFWGGYEKYCHLNWATKFFADAVMDYLQCEKKAA